MNTHGLRSKLAAVIFIALLAFSGPALADTVELTYTNEAGVEQTLIIDENSSEADLALAATLILNGNVTVSTTSDGEGDLAAITASISAAATNVAGGNAANMDAASIAIETAIPDTTDKTNTAVAPAETVVVTNPSKDTPPVTPRAIVTPPGPPPNMPPVTPPVTPPGPPPTKPPVASKDQI